LAPEALAATHAGGAAGMALQADSIVAGYAGNQVLHGVTVDARRGEVVLILGPNGAGKSTLLSVISGLVRQRSGKIFVDGKDVGGAPVHQRAKMGVAHVPEGRRIFPRQSVKDNLLLGTLAGKADKEAREESFRWVYELFPILERKQRHLAATLSGGEQQMLAIAQGVMSRPRILLLDEPSAGLAPILAKQVLDRVRLLSEGGISVLIVEQTAGAIAVADRVFVMRNGEVVASGSSDEFREQDLASQYLGTDQPGQG
jgi:branched-chain amino acid transport system ATP-binding protein